METSEARVFRPATEGAAAGGKASFANLNLWLAGLPLCTEFGPSVPFNPAIKLTYLKIFLIL